MDLLPIKLEVLGNNAINANHAHKDIQLTQTLILVLLQFKSLLDQPAVATRLSTNKPTNASSAQEVNLLIMATTTVLDKISTTANAGTTTSTELLKSEVPGKIAIDANHAQLDTLLTEPLTNVLLQSLEYHAVATRLLTHKPTNANSAQEVNLLIKVTLNVFLMTLITTSASTTTTLVTTTNS
jgi:hypothetical protein